MDSSQQAAVWGPANGIPVSDAPPSKRQRVTDLSEDELPAATALDYRPVPDDEVLGAYNLPHPNVFGAYNPDFYLIKVKVIDVLHPCYVKRNEIPLLNAIAQEKKYYVSCTRNKQVDYMRVVNGVYRHTTSLALINPQGIQLLPELVFEESRLPIAPKQDIERLSKEYLDSLFYLAVKYPTVEFSWYIVMYSHDNAKARQASKQRSLTASVENLQTQQKQLDILLQGIEKQRQIVAKLKEDLDLPRIIARIAYERGLMPEDPAVIEAAKQEYAGQ